MILAAILLLSAAQAADPQVDCENAMTQTDMNICSFRSYKRADSELNAAWSRASEHAKEMDRNAARYDGDATAHSRLLAAQRAWLKFRDAHCLAENGERENSGTIWPLLQNGCLEALTEARTAQLRQYVEMPN
ncbi:lysozyme inhibitor LprI family protein [Citromicrobium bathyomarinum]|uniref:lysozyme inhibitor LprI family protein n=1 Tax=Citromicrobium bathyomarinum TaxID=72174 RepID=UPI00315AEDD7